MSHKIDYRREGQIGILTMDDGKANAIENTWLDDWEAAVATARQDRVGALVVRGRDNIFCAGLNLKVLPTLPPDEVQAFARRYQQVKTDLFQLELPIVGDVAGHALAGGAVMLLCCDYAVTDAAPKKIGLTETQVGIVLPAFVIAMGQARLNPAQWSQALIAGDTYDPAGALAAGFVHEVAPDAATRAARAMARAEYLAGLPADAYRASKRAIRQAALAPVASADDPAIGSFFSRQG